MAIYNDRIRELRQLNQLTQSETAMRIGITEATLSRYESGRGIKSIPYEVIVKLALVFDCSPCYIMGWSDNDDSPTPYYLHEDDGTHIIIPSSTLLDAAEIQSIIDFFHTHPAYIELITSLKNLSEDDLPFLKEMLDRFQKK